jgi:hypothetical protein
MRKVIATIQVEFVAKEGQSDNVLTIALSRGVGRLEHAIELGETGSAPTGIKSGSVKTWKTYDIVDVD